MPDQVVTSPPTFESVGVVNYVPSGACTLPNTLLKSTSADGPGLYQCVPDDDTYTTGTWQKIGAGGGGSIGGGVDSGYVPIAVSVNTLGNGPIDYGVTISDGLTIKNAGAGGTLIEDTGGGGITIIDYYDGVGAGVQIVTDAGALELIGGGDASSISLNNGGTDGTTITDSGGGGIELNDSAGGGIELYSSGGGGTTLTLGGGLVYNNNADDGTSITDSGGGGIYLTASTGASTIQLSNSGTGSTQLVDNGGGGILIDPVGGAATSPGNVVIGGLLVPGTIYSAAGTPLPDPTLTPGARAFVSDATANVYGTAYASGGAIKAPVYSDGTTWNMG